VEPPLFGRLLGSITALTPVHRRGYRELVQLQPGGTDLEGFDPETLTLPAEETINYAFYPQVPWIDLELTNRCNLKCPYCANSTLSRARGCLSWDLLEKLADECSGKPYGINCLHGTGEPLLYKWQDKRVEDVIRLVHSRKAGKAIFGSNAVLLTQERAHSLLDAGLTDISISLDTLDAALYARTRGADLGKVVGNIKDLIRLAPKTFGISIWLMEHKEQQINESSFALGEQTFGKHPNVRYEKAVNHYFVGASENWSTHPGRGNTCRVPSVHQYIAFDGRVAVCCADQDVRHELGAIQQQTVEEIWYSAKNQTTFRNLALGLSPCPEVCLKCKLDAGRLRPIARARVGLGDGVSYDQALALAKRFRTQGQEAKARQIAEALKNRCHWDHREIDDFLETPPEESPGPQAQPNRLARFLRRFRRPRR
jgi:hypothetical protein